MRRALHCIASAAASPSECECEISSYFTFYSLALSSYYLSPVKMPIGVGSVGDIISICLLAKDLVEALNSSRGASAEYQEIVRELWGLERALLQVDLLYRTHNDSPELNALHETARRAVDNCQVCIAGFLDKIKKYQPSLRENGSGSVFRDTSRKIQWQVMQSSDVPKFRAEIGAHSQSVSMLLATLSV